MIQQIQLPYGTSSVSLRLPERQLAGVFLPQSVPVCPDPAAEIRRALARPLDLPPLEEIVKPGETVVILLDDHTRATPAALILPPLLETLETAGVRLADITLLITHGTHRLSSETEVRRKVGETIYGRLRIEQHRCEDVASQVYLGLTGRGTPVWVNRLAVETDRLIGIGHVGPSPYAGYSGGRKLIVPGVAALDTINASHSHVPLGFRQYGRADVPCRLDLQEAGALVKMDLVIDVVLSQDERIVRAFAGTPECVFAEGLTLAKQVSEVPFPGQVDGPADIAITSGAPYDIDLYQAVRAVEYADPVVREGGAIFLIAACPDGAGGEDFYTLMADRNKKPDDYLRAVVRRDGRVTFSVLGYALSRIKAEKKLHIFCAGLSAQELDAMGFHNHVSPQAGVDALLSEYGPQARVAVFPQGSTTIPVYG
jgi:nickel-dependent lactate racemase